MTSKQTYSRTRRFGALVAAAVAVIIGSATALAAHDLTLPPNGVRIAPSDSADVVAAVAKFHASLVAGDTAAVLALLAEDVTILEGSRAETKAAYRAGHMGGDMAYAKAVPSKRTVTSVKVSGDWAWMTSSSTTEGEYRGRQINSTGSELVVLSRANGVWTIRAVHWASQARRAAP